MNEDPLFSLKRFKEKIVETPKCTFDIIKVEGGALYLSRDGDSADVIIGETYHDHFRRMGEMGFLRDAALELYEKEYGVKDD